MRHDILAYVLDTLATIDPPARVLDIGCGTGWFTDRLNRAGYETLGIDRTRRMRMLRRVLGRRKCRLADIHSVDLRGKYSVALCVGLMHSVSMPERMTLLMAAKQAVGARGTIIVVDYVPDRDVARKKQMSITNILATADEILASLLAFWHFKNLGRRS